jgi:hypothetical protein
VAKYESVWGGWCSGDIVGSHGVGLWKFICKGWQTFRNHFRFLILLRAQRSAFGMTFGVGIELLKRLFLACLI